MAQEIGTRSQIQWPVPEFLHTIRRKVRMKKPSLEQIWDGVRLSAAAAAAAAAAASAR
jgi:hypothetical protein